MTKKPKAVHICSSCLKEIPNQKKLFWRFNKRKTALLLTCEECTDDRDKPYLKPRNKRTK